MDDDLFDRIYAIRLSLMDIYYDEKIIKSIKLNLHKYDNIMDEEELNNLIIEFYKRYDIDITTINLNELNIINTNDNINNTNNTNININNTNNTNININNTNNTNNNIDNLINQITNIVTNELKLY